MSPERLGKWPVIRGGAVADTIFFFLIYSLLKKTQKNFGTYLDSLKLQKKVLKLTLNTLNESRKTWQMTYHQKNLLIYSLLTKKKNIKKKVLKINLL